MAADCESPAQGWYVVIGIDHYLHENDGISKLTNAVNDARAVADLLRTTYGYQELQPLLWDSGATLKALTDLLEYLKKQDHPCDNLIIYYAGHGIADDNPATPYPIGYLVPHDAINVEDLTKAGLLAMKDLRACLEALNFRKVLAILDCCHAGGIGLDAVRDSRRPQGLQFKEVFEEYREQPTRQALSSATFSQKAQDVTRFGTLGRRGSGDNSPFAAALLEVLKADDGDIWDEGVLDATGLKYHVSRRMREQGFTQTPGLWTLDRNEVDFLFEPLGLESLRRSLPPEPDYNPYRGLLPYEAADCDLFFGRESERAELRQRVVDNPVVALSGRSGVGKSSLLRAGLIGELLYPDDRNARPRQLPLLKKDDRPVRVAAYPPTGSPACWGALLLRPGAAPIAGLAKALGELLRQDVSPDELNADPGALAARVGEFIGAQSDGFCLLFALDQFEDLLFECRNERERVRFLDILGRALAAQPDGLRLAVAYRTDNRIQIEQLVASSPSLSAIWNQEKPEDREFELREMGVDGLRAVIEQPLRRYHVRLESTNGKSLEDTIFESVRGEPGALPLLSFTLSQMYEAFARRWRRHIGADRILTFDDYNTIHGATGSLGQRADEVYGALVNEDTCYKHTIPNVMLRMVQITGEGGARPVSEDELTYPDEAENERVWAFVHDMEEAGLLVVSGSEPHRQVEPAHSALMVRWDRLRQWRDEKAAVSHLPVQRELAEAARKPPAERVLWDRHPKLPQLAEELWGAAPGRMLWPGPMAAIRSLPPPGPGSWLSKKEAEFVQESIRVRARSQLIGLLLLAVFVIGLSLAAVVAWVQKGVAEEAKARAVAEATRADEQRAVAVAATTAEATARIYADERRIAAETAASKEATARAAEEKERVKAELAATAEAQAKAAAESRRVEAEREAKLALSRELAARSSLELAAGRLETAQILAIQSGLITDTAQAFDAIRVSLAQPGRTVAMNQVEAIDCRARLSFQGQPGELKVSYSSGGSFTGPAGLVLQNATTGEKVTLRGYPRPTTFDLRAFQSPAGPYVLIVGLDYNEARIWNSEADSQVALLLPATGPLTELAGAWSPSGQLVATTGCGVQTFPNTQCGQGGVWVWNAFSGSRKFTLTGHSDWACDPRWLADDRLRTVSSDGTAREWVLTPGSELPSLSLDEGKAETAAPSQFACALSDAQKRTAIRPFTYRYPRGRSLICIADRLWLTSFSGAVLVNGLTAGVMEMWDEVAVFDAQLSSDGQQIALAGCRGGREGLDPRWGVFCEEAMLQLLNARDGRLLADLPVTGKVITSVSWSGEGGQLLLAANDQEYAEMRKPLNPRIVVIDTASRTEICTISSTDEAPNRIAWSADNAKILAFGPKVVRQYFLNMPDLIDAACDSTPRNLTWDEWNQFMTGPYRPTCPGRLIPESAAQGIHDEAASEIRSGQLESARQRLKELNTWLAQSQQTAMLGVEVEQFINQTLKR